MENTHKSSRKIVLISFLVLALGFVFLIGFMGKKDAIENKGLIATTQKQADRDLEEIYLLSLQKLKSSLPQPETFQEIEHETYYVKGRHDDPSKYMEVVIEYRTLNNEGGMVASKDFFTYNSAKELTAKGKAGQ